METTKKKRMRGHDDALGFHASMQELHEALVKEGAQSAIGFDGDPMKELCRDVWDAIVSGGAMSKPGYPQLIELHMPFEVMTLVRAQSEIASAFAYCCALQCAAKMGLTDQAAQAAWKMVAERKGLAEKVKEGFGCDRSPAWEHARELSGSPDVRAVEEIARMAGEMHSVMRGRRKVRSDDAQQVADVEHGGDPERLLASEIALLSDPSTTDLAAIKVLEQSAQQYRMEGERPGESGPLVILVDESGSMHDGTECNRNTWAKGALIAMARIAHADQRMVSCVHFGTSTAVTRLPPGDSKALLDASRHFLSGGTSIALGLTVAAQEVEQLRLEGHVGADIVIITDGGDPSHDAIEHVLSLTQARGTKLWTVLIEMDGDPNSPIIKRASQVIRIARTDRADQVAALVAAANATESNPERAKSRNSDQRFN